ncbi:hypothetical protein V6M85_13980 (plasmid) [Sulfolobus tengchongensis]|uniref:Uncharacterized protein n=1 Tax=Sulfolobus tengchongensis TaxID=207809 RepID=A0AAX4L3W3_9CREN
MRLFYIEGLGTVRKNDKVVTRYKVAFTDIFGRYRTNRKGYVTDIIEIVYSELDRDENVDKVIEELRELLKQRRKEVIVDEIEFKIAESIVKVLALAGMLYW